MKDKIAIRRGVSGSFGLEGAPVLVFGLRNSSVLLAELHGTLRASTYSGKVVAPA